MLRLHNDIVLANIVGYGRLKFSSIYTPKMNGYAISLNAILCTKTKSPQTLGMQHERGHASPTHIVISSRRNFQSETQCV